MRQRNALYPVLVAESCRATSRRSPQLYSALFAQLIGKCERFELTPAIGAEKSVENVYDWVLHAKTSVTEPVGGGHCEEGYCELSLWSDAFKRRLLQTRIVAVGTFVPFAIEDFAVRDST
jgi:hypothetical protein